MPTEKVAVHIGRDRCVITEAETRYTGTLTGGGRNVEVHEVSLLGYTVEGTWDQDGRHLTQVVDCPDALAAELLPLWEQQNREQARRDLAAVQAHERAFYGRVLTR